MLATFCQTYGRYLECEEAIQREGMTVESHGSLRVHPLAKHAKELAGELRRIASEYGFTPASRKRVTEARADQPDELDDFLKEVI